jgi:2-dehydropantoate 2-reductase
MTFPPKIGVLGAGAVGCYVGARLAGVGADVVFVGRDRLAREVAAHGLAAAAPGNDEARVAPADVRFRTDASALAGREVVLVCAKSAATEACAQELASISPEALVVSLQNGVRNADVLRAGLPRARVLGGIVGFNVVPKGDGVFLQATSGPLVVEASDDPRARALCDALATAGFELEEPTDIAAMQWTKLIINLNNAVSALSGASTEEILMSPGYRRVLAAVMREGLAVLRAAGVRTARLGPLPVGLFPALLSLPTPVLRVAARAQVKVDPDARSSMWQDLAQGRATEVDYLNGELVRLAASCGARAPLNARIVALVHQVEERGAGSPRLDADALWTALRAPA